MILPTMILQLSARPVDRCRCQSDWLCSVDIFCQHFSIHREADRTMQGTGMQAMISKPSRSPGFFVAHHEWRRGDLEKIMAGKIMKSECAANGWSEKVERFW